MYFVIVLFEVFASLVIITGIFSSSTTRSELAGFVVALCPRLPTDGDKVFAAAAEAGAGLGAEELVEAEAKRMVFAITSPPTVL